MGIVHEGRLVVRYSKEDGFAECELYHFASRIMHAWRSGSRSFEWPEFMNIEISLRVTKFGTEHPLSGKWFRHEYVTITNGKI